MLWQTTVPSRQHNHYLGCIWFGTKEIRALLREVKHFREVNRDYRYFIVSQHRNRAEETFTNGYLPWPWLQKALDWSLEGGVDLVDERGDARRTSLVQSAAPTITAILCKAGRALTYPPS